MKRRKTISGHTIVKLLKTKIEKKKMNAGGGENRYITQRGKIIWKMTDFSAKQWREENGIKTFRFYTKTCKFRILHVAIYLKSEGKTKTF